MSKIDHANCSACAFNPLTTKSWGWCLDMTSIHWAWRHTGRRTMAGPWHNTFGMSLAPWHICRHHTIIFKPVIAQLVEHLTVDSCSNQMVPGSIPGDRISKVYRGKPDLEFFPWSCWSQIECAWSFGPIERYCFIAVVMLTISTTTLINEKSTFNHAPVV